LILQVANGFAGLATGIYLFGNPHIRGKLGIQLSMNYNTATYDVEVAPNQVSL